MAKEEDFRDALEAFGARVTAVPDGKWSADSPCEGWTAGDVTRHVIRNMHGLVAALNGDDFLAPVEPPSGADVVSAWVRARKEAETALDVGDRVAVAEVRIGSRTASVSYLIDGLMRDLVIHTWDLARAVGGDERLPADLVRAATVAMDLVTEAMRRPGSYGPALAAPEGADAQTRLLALSGRVA